MLRTIGTTQTLPHLRSAQVCMSECDPAPLSYLLKLDLLKGNCNTKIKNSFMLETDSSSCIRDRKNNLDF